MPLATEALALDPAMQVLGLGVDMPLAAVKAAFGEPTETTTDTLTYLDGALVARYTKAPVIGVKASAGPLAALGGDIAKASRLLGPPDSSDAIHALWIVPSPAVEAFRMTLTCTNGMCTEAHVLAPGTTW